MAVVSRVKKGLKTKTEAKSSFEAVIPGPDDLNEPSDRFGDYVTLIYGESGVGKTSLFAKFEDSLTIMMEPKRRGLRNRQVEIRPVSMRQLRKLKTPGPWEQFVAFVDKCKVDKSVKTVCVDNVDRAFEACQQAVCLERGYNHPNEAKDYGQTWDAIRETFAETMDDLIYAEKGLVFGSKFSFKEVERRDGENYERLQPSCSNTCFKYLKDCTDFAFYYGYVKGRRVFYIRPDEDVWTKVGAEDTFMGPTGKPLRILLAGESPKDAYRTLVEGFANKRSEFEREDAPKKKVKKVRESVS